MHSFYVKGIRVSQKAAYAKWIASPTYHNANRRTRHEIWGTVLNGDSTGNHNPHGEVEHLLEAGIELK